MSLAPSFQVLVTRPSPQGEALCQVLKEQGFTPHFLPVIDIKANPDPQFQEQLKSLAHYDWVIFVSPQAVACSAALLHQQWPQWPSHLKVAAVGEGTATALQAAKLPVTVYPALWSSEGLLALPELQAVAAKKVALFCAEGGRELLAQSLRARGAEVDAFFAYQRLLPRLNLLPTEELLEKQQLQAVVCTSVQALKNLKQLFAGPSLAALQKIPLVLVSERIMIQAKEQGFSACVLAADPSHASIVQALQTIRNKPDAFG